MTRTDLVGTLDELEPQLRERGYVAVRTMAGPVDLATFDPYGARRVGSVNVQTEKWAHHVYRGRLAFDGTTPYLADAEPPSEGFFGGLFPLLTGSEIHEPIVADALTQFCRCGHHAESHVDTVGYCAFSDCDCRTFSEVHS